MSTARIRTSSHLEPRASRVRLRARLSGTRLLSVAAISALAPLVACSAAPEAEVTSSTAAALDPMGVLTATNYTITLQTVNVLQAQDTAFTRHQPVTSNCSYWWTPDSTFMDWAELGVQVNAALPSIQACTLGQANGSSAATTGTTLTKCVAGSYQNNMYQQNKPLAVPFAVASVNDQVTFGVAMDNIEGLDPNSMTASSSSITTAAALATTGDATQTLGNAFQGIGLATTAFGPVGIGLAIVGSAISVVGDLFPQPPQQSCGTFLEASCVGSLMASPTALFSNGQVANSVKPGNDTAWIQLTGRALLAATSGGPATIDLYPTSSFGAAGTYANGISPYTCASSLHLHLVIARDWTTGPAASGKSGDMAAVRAPGTIDAVAVDPSNTSQIVHHFGQGGSFGNELESPAQATQAAGVDISTSAVVVSRAESNDDIFWVDKIGGLYDVSQSSPTYTWQVQTLVPPAHTIGLRPATLVSSTIPSIAPGDANLTATARTPNNLDVFFVGTDGNVYNVSGVSTTTAPMTWMAAHSITTPSTIAQCNARSACAGAAAPGGGIAAVSRTATNTDVFFTGKDGGIWTTSWSQASGIWSTTELDGASSPYQNDGALVPPGASVTATARTSQQLDVFFVGAQGDLWRSSWDGSWATAKVNGTARSGMAGGPVSAVARQPGTLDIVYFGANGGLEWVAWSKLDNTAWTLTSLPQGINASPSTYGRPAVSVVAPDAFSLQVFWLNGFHQMQTLTWTDLEKCSSLTNIGCTSVPSIAGGWTLAP